MGIRDMWENGSGGGDYDVLPAGTYDCESEDLTHTPGMDGIMRTEITCTVTTGQHEGRKIWIKVKHAQNQVFLMRMVWDGHGLQGTPFDGLDDDASEEEMWNAWGRMVYESLGASIRVKVAHRKWVGNDGKERTSLSIKDVSQIKQAAQPAESQNVPWA